MSRRLSHPEFSSPAALAILIGVAFAAANAVLNQHDFVPWGIPVYLVLTGIALARKSRLGTLILLVGLVALVVHRAGDLMKEGFGGGGPMFYPALKLLLGLLWLSAMGAAVWAQFAFSGRGRCGQGQAIESRSRWRPVRSS